MERRVELFAAIRFDWQRHRMPVRALARKYDVHRRTVLQAIASPVPPDRKVPVRAAPVREAVAGWIDEMPREDLAAPRKQRHTARPTPPSANGHPPSPTRGSARPSSTGSPSRRTSSPPAPTPTGCAPPPPATRPPAPEPTPAEVT
jgi:hypothetical protein